VKVEMTLFFELGQGISSTPIIKENQSFPMPGGDLSFKGEAKEKVGTSRKACTNAASRYINKRKKWIAEVVQTFLGSSRKKNKRPGTEEEEGNGGMMEGETARGR